MLELLDKALKQFSYLYSICVENWDMEFSFSLALSLKDPK